MRAKKKWNRNQDDKRKKRQKQAADHCFTSGTNCETH
jgi:hypothetical protein